MKVTSLEYKPSHRLSHLVESYWSYGFEAHASAVSPTNICIPKGTIQIILTLSGQVEMLVDSEWTRVEEKLVAGIQTAPCSWRVHANTQLFGISLKPNSFLQLSGIPIAEIYQKHLPLQSLTGNRLNGFTDQVKNAHSTQDRIILIESFLSKMQALLQCRDNLLTKAIRTIWKEEGNISTSLLSRSVFIGERQLQRLFKTTVGVSPKLYSRIVRFRNAYEKAQAPKRSAWTDVAYDTGYTDQAHFVKDFKTFTGLTPTALFN